MPSIETHVSGREMSAVFIGMTLIFFALLSMTGNLTSGPRIVDDNQIYRLEKELATSSSWAVLRKELRSRLLDFDRLVPVYLIHKVAAVKLYSSNLILWSIHTGFVAVLTSFFLYFFVRVTGFTPTEGILFSLLTLVGEQSVISWRLLHGEGIGMLFLSLSLVFMALGVKDSDRFNIRTGLFLFFALFVVPLQGELHLDATRIGLLARMATCGITGNQPATSIKKQLGCRRITSGRNDGIATHSRAGVQPYALLLHRMDGL